jgi:hypothetical protein
MHFSGGRAGGFLQTASDSGLVWPENNHNPAGRGASFSAETSELFAQKRWRVGPVNAHFSPDIAKEG